MLLFLRKLLFYIFLAVYLILTPYVVLYGLGYAVDPAQREIVKTGLISIVTEPRGANVFIEDKKYSGKTPAVIAGLHPGQYHVRLSMKNFEPWQKTVEIVAEKATRLEPVVLFPRKADEERITDLTYVDILPRGSDFKIFAQQGKSFQNLYRVDLLFKKENPVFEVREKTEPLQILDDIISPESSTVLFKVKKTEGEGWVLADLEREKILADLSPLIPEKPDLAVWDPKNSSYLYLLKDGTLAALDVEQNQVLPVETADVLGAGVRQRRLYFLKKDLTLWQATAKGENAVQLTEKDGIETKAFPKQSDDFYRIELLKRVLFQRELFLFLGNKGALMSNWPPYQLAEKNARGFLHSIKGDSEKILYWTPQEIAIFDFSMKNEEEESLPPRVLIYRSGTDIRQVFWAFDHTHVLFVDKNEIFLIEAGESAPYLIRSLERIAPGTRIFYNDHQQAVYFLHPENRKLIKRKISE